MVFPVEPEVVFDNDVRPRGRVQDINIDVDDKFEIMTFRHDMTRIVRETIDGRVQQRCIALQHRNKGQ